MGSQTSSASCCASRAAVVMTRVRLSRLSRNSSGSSVLLPSAPAADDLDGDCS